MNEFTKEELEQIMWAIHGEYPIPIGLGNKIQSMIENYCEHDFQMNMHDAEWHCCKCGFLQ